MKYALLLLSLFYGTAFAQQKESNVSISCYVNPELYLQAGVIAHVSDKAGNISCNGKYVSIVNKSPNAFYYKRNTGWTMVKPGEQTIILVAGTGNASSTAPSILKLNVRYRLDSSGDVTAKMAAIAQMNALSDRAKAIESGSSIAKQEERGLNEATNQALAIMNKPLPTETSTRPSETSAKPSSQPRRKDSDPKIAVVTPPKTPPIENKPKPELKKNQEVKKVESLGRSNAAGLRIDFGTGPTGIGPNIRHKFNRALAIDAALLFFEGDKTGLEGQLEHYFPLQGTSGLNWYIGIGPQFIFHKKETTTGLVPVTGLEFNIPAVPLNFSLDWRPRFNLSPGTDVEAGRFGLSLRLTF